MATKINMLKLMQEINGMAEMNRRPAPQPPLYPMQLRPRTFQPVLPRHRLPIRIDPKDQGTVAVPVKITFLKPSTAKV